MTRKTYRRKYSRNGRKARKNTRKTRHTIKGRYTRKGGNGDDKVNCCMCGKEIKISEGLIPRVCLEKYGSRAHRICKDCWFDGPNAFATEGISHKCPGCEKGLPLTKVPEKPKDPENPKKTVFIDLTEE